MAATIHRTRRVEAGCYTVSSNLGYSVTIEHESSAMGWYARVNFSIGASRGGFFTLRAAKRFADREIEKRIQRDVVEVLETNKRLRSQLGLE